MSAPSGIPDDRAKWRTTAGEGLPLDLESVFPVTQGFFVKRANDRRAKLIAALAPTLTTALEKGERVRYAARGHQYVAGEYYFSGMFAAMHTNQLALVLTDKRVLLVQVDGKGRARDIKNQIRLSEIRRAKNAGIFGSYWTIETLDKKKLMVMSLPKADRRALEAMIPAQPEAAATATPSLEHLCPACMKVVPGPVGSIERCPNEACRIPFRSPKKAARLSLLVPGVGDIYLRHFLFGAMEFVGSMAALGAALYLTVLAAMSGLAEEIIAAGIVGFFGVVLARVIDYFLTLHMGKKGLVPLSLSAAPLSAAEGGALGPRAQKSLPAFPAWAYAMFLAGAIGIAGTIAAAIPTAQAKGLLAEANQAAEAGQIEEAWTLWEQVAERDENDRARFILALYHGGDLEGGDKLLQGLPPVEVALAEGINKFIAMAQSAGEDYQKGRQALLEGEEKDAWAPIDRALAFYQSMPRTTLPKNHGEVLLELAGELLAPPPSDADAAMAEGFVKMAAKTPLLDGRLLIAEARLLSYQDEGGPAAREKIAKTEPSKLQPPWALLALETRAHLAGDDAELAKIGEQAEGFAQDKLDDAGKARRVALIAIGGRAPKADPAVAAAAADLAESMGWDKAAARLREATAER